MTGRTKASVLPVPVCAVATRFCPASAGSMAIDWIGVGTVNPCRARLLFNSGDRESSEKVFIIQVVRKENQRTDHRLRKRDSRLDFVKFQLYHVRAAESLEPACIS